MIFDDIAETSTTKLTEQFYWERVNRNLGWLGNSSDEQQKRQNLIANATVGIAGCGGIGGAVALRLARMGVKNIKLADPDDFDTSNINRQLGATISSIGKNKALVVSEEIKKLTNDVNVMVFEDGITPETSDAFVDGCDYIMDQMDFYQIKNRYALHRSFRKSSLCKFMFKIPVIGFRVFVYKYTKDSMPIEEVYGLNEDAQMTEKAAMQLVERLIPEMPSFPDSQMLHEWFCKKLTCPIFAGCPPIAEGILTARLGLALTGLEEDLQDCTKIPVQPGYMMIDVVSWETKTHSGKWW